MRLHADETVPISYVIGLSIVLGVLTWRSGDVQNATNLLGEALGSLFR